MTGEYVMTRETEHGTQYRPACHYCPYGETGPWTWFREGAQVNATLHQFAHSTEGMLW